SAEVPSGVRWGLLCGLGAANQGAVRPLGASVPMAVAPVRRIRDVHPTTPGGTPHGHPWRVLRVEHHLPERDESAGGLAIGRDRAGGNRPRVVDAFVASTDRSEV